MRKILCGAVLLLTVVSGCSGLSGTCSVPLQGNGCATTFDLQVRTGSMFPASPGSCASAGVCGTHRVWRSPPNLGSVTCVYDSSGQTLISLTQCTDYNAFCDNKEVCISGGQRIDPASSCDVGQLPMACPSADASAD
jgi:hypothetical protein